MAYPASEMIANTIAEAIKTADRMSGWDYFEIISSAFAALGTLGLLLWEMNKSYKERARVRSVAKLKKIEKQHRKIIGFLVNNNLAINTRSKWGKAYIELLNLSSISSIETQDIKDEAQSERDAFMEELKLILIDGDPEKQSLRWQFFTGVTDWQTNNDGWGKISKKANIGNAFGQADSFGNYDKKDSIHNLSPYHIIAVYHFLYTGIIPKVEYIKFPNVKDELRNKKELMEKITIQETSPKWLQEHEKLDGLIYFLFNFYTQPIDDSVNRIHS